MSLFKVILALALVTGGADAFTGLSARASGRGRATMALSDYQEELANTANTIASKGKGLLACDESTKTVGARLESIGLENTEENRRDWRGLLFTTKGLGKYVSGAILYEETLFQTHKDGDTQVEKLKAEGIIPGIKVDTGLFPLEGGIEGETVCTGLDGLGARCAKYYEQGARFAKWRTALRIDVEKGCPSNLAVQEAAWGLARYARICQENGLCPIVEPEILMDGSHPIEVTAAVQERVIAAVYKACNDNGVYLEGSLLKPSMTVAGIDTAAESPERVAEYTIRVLERVVPSAVPGITFLSGGLSEEDSSIFLNEMNKRERKGPWSVTFSFSRAMQSSTIKQWGGKDENVEKAQKQLLARAQANSEAQQGIYKPGSQPSDQASLYVKNYQY